MSFIAQPGIPDNVFGWIMGKIGTGFALYLIPLAAVMIVSVLVKKKYAVNALNITSALPLSNAAVVYLHYSVTNPTFFCTFWRVFLEVLNAFSAPFFMQSSR